jgi:oxalate decarboxylase
MSSDMRQAEWGIVYEGEILVSAVDEQGKFQVERLGYGDIWYFPKGQAHTIQGLAEENEYLLAFDDGNFDAVGYELLINQSRPGLILNRVTFNIADWLIHTPRSVLAKNFGVNESVFENFPTTNPYILNGTSSNDTNISGPNGALTGNASYVYRTLQHDPEPVPGRGGTFYKIDSTNFPISKTIAATFVTLKPGGLRELHWHPNVCDCPIIRAPLISQSG